MLRGRRLALLIALLLLIALVLAGPAREAVLGLGDWFAHAGALGIVAYFALFTFGSLLVVPGSMLTVLAGFAYGVGAGFLVALPAASVAAWINFLVARLARPWVQRALRGHPRLLAVCDAAGAQGFRWVLLLRLSPVIPFSILNYTMGVSGIRQRDFVLASTLGKAPSVLAYVYVGSALSVLTRAEPGAQETVWTRVLFWVGLVATLTVALQIARVVRRQTQALLDDRFSADAKFRSEGIAPRK